MTVIALPGPPIVWLAVAALLAFAAYRLGKRRRNT